MELYYIRGILARSECGGNITSPNNAHNIQICYDSIINCESIFLKGVIKKFTSMVER